MEILETSDCRDIALLRYAFAPSPFGEVLTACDADALCFAGFAVGDRLAALDDLARRFPCARLAEDSGAAVDIFAGDAGRIRLVGSDFRRAVWRALLTVGRGETLSYSGLAVRAGVPRAVRAVASAVAANPLSIVVPCHRIIRNDGSAGRYHWGSGLKARLLESEKIKD